MCDQRIYNIYISYSKQVAAETKTEETAYYPQQEGVKQAMSKSKSRKGRKRGKKR